MTLRITVLCLISLTAAATELSLDGVDFGRRVAVDLDAGLTVSVTSPPDAPEQCFLIARFQDNRPLMRDATGRWLDWNGEPDALVDVGCSRNDQDLVFEIAAKPLTDMTFPVVFTFGYRFAGETRSGFITVDEP